MSIAPAMLSNRTFDELAIGDSASMQRQLTQQDIQLFAVMSGDINPAHLDADYAAATQFQGVIAHGMWGGALISGVLGTTDSPPTATALSWPVRPVDFSACVADEVRR